MDKYDNIRLRSSVCFSNMSYESYESFVSALRRWEYDPFNKSILTGLTLIACIAIFSVVIYFSHKGLPLPPLAVVAVPVLSALTFIVSVFYLTGIDSKGLDFIRPVPFVLNAIFAGIVFIMSIVIMIVPKAAFGCAIAGLVVSVIHIVPYALFSFSFD